MSLRFDADLSAVSDGASLSVRSDAAGDLVVTTDELRPLIASLGGGGLPVGTLRTVSDRLADLGATVHLRTPSTGLLTLGEDARPGLAERAARLDHVTIESARGLLVAMRPPLRAVLPAAAVVLAASAVAVLGRRRLR